MESLFKALGDETRRALLDRLRVRDGQTLTELERDLGMTRFGVMKHLRVLEEARLVVTRRQGRFKHHYLNAAPIQELADRWIAPFTQAALTRAAIDLKSRLEGESEMSVMTETRPDFVLETFIRTTPERLWQALTDGEMTRLYYIAGAALQGRIEAGGEYRYMTPGDQVMLSGEVIRAEPPRRLEMTFTPHWPGTHPNTTRNAFEIEPAGELTKLTILHYDLPPNENGIREGWAKIAASLKSLLETGEALNFG